MSDQSLRYIDKKKKVVVPSPIVSTPNILENLDVNDIKTNVVGKSCIISKGRKQQHIILNNVKTWYVDGNILYISVIDNETPILLIFPSSIQAKQAELRFVNIFNGALLI
jgi:hypothetical protein